MADFFLDHNANQGIVAELTARNHSVVTAIGQRRDRASDPEILLSSVRERRTVITYNRGDFRMLHDAWLRWGMSPRHYGILIIPQGWTPTQAAEEISRMVASRPGLRNELWDWRPSTGWTQFDPLSQQAG
jgi:hypothetical protein